MLLKSVSITDRQTTDGTVMSVAEYVMFDRKSRGQERDEQTDVQPAIIWLVDSACVITTGDEV